jgi:hypothetical protein
MSCRALRRDGVPRVASRGGTSGRALDVPPSEQPELAHMIESRKTTRMAAGLLNHRFGSALV